MEFSSDIEKLAIELAQRSEQNKRKRKEKSSKVILECKRRLKEAIAEKRKIVAENQKDQAEEAKTRLDTARKNMTSAFKNCGQLREKLRTSLDNINAAVEKIASDCEALKAEGNSWTKDLHQQELAEWKSFETHAVTRLQEVKKTAIAKVIDVGSRDLTLLNLDISQQLRFLCPKEPLS